MKSLVTVNVCAMVALPELVVYCGFLLLACAPVFHAAEEKAVNKECVCGWNPEETSLIITSETSTELQHAKIDRELPADIVFLTLRFDTVDNFTHDREVIRSARLSEDIYVGVVLSSTWVVTKSRLYSRLSPRLFDSLSLGAVDVSSRSNSSVLLLPAPICDDSSASEIFRSIIKSVSA